MVDVAISHHIYFHITPSEDPPAWALELKQLLGVITQKEDTIMVTVTDIQTKADATLADVRAETDVVDAVKLVVDNMNVNIATLKQQLADAIAAGVDPAALQTLSDTIDSIQTSNMANTAKVSEAVVAGTPVAVVPPTPDV